ncbi:hypothetical protein GmHk_18G052616 [Glycine max]|nr:hypothetical protein GmHk_18G052616 [Glycine max]
MPFTKSEPHRDNPSLVFRNPYILRNPRSLNQISLNKKKKKNSLFKRKILQLKINQNSLLNMQVFGQGIFLRG